MNFDHTFHQVGTFTAVLSVPNELRRNVYWKQQSLDINVKTNMVLQLQNDMKDLKQEVLNLTTVVQGK